MILTVEKMFHEEQAARSATAKKHQMSLDFPPSPVMTCFKTKAVLSQKRRTFSGLDFPGPWGKTTNLRNFALFSFVNPMFTAPIQTVKVSLRIYPKATMK